MRAFLNPFCMFLAGANAVCVTWQLSLGHPAQASFNAFAMTLCLLSGVASIRKEVRP